MAGTHAFLPFALYMPTLFEKFVLEWLKKHCPANIDPMRCVKHVKPPPAPLTFEMDMILQDHETKDIKAVLDTKYKTDESQSTASNPSNEDIYQIVTYAYRMKSPQAILIYPSGTPRGL